MNKIIILVFIGFTLQVASFFIWFFNIGNYLRSNGKSTLRGVNFGATILNDLGQVIEIFKESREWPKFVTVFLIVEVISILSLVLSVLLQQKLN